MPKTPPDEEWVFILIAIALILWFIIIPIITMAAVIALIVYLFMHPLW